VRRPPTPGIGRTLALFFALTAAATAIAAFVIADRRDPERTLPTANLVAPPELDAIQRGDTEAVVRQELGEPARITRDAAATDRCLIYEQLTATQSTYRFCFNGDRLVEFSPQ
jgi:hypothetical protein